MIELKEGCSVPFPELLFEEFELCEGYIAANINASKVVDAMSRFIELHRDEHMFFILEIPSKAEDESLYGQVVTGSFSDDVYYIDGLTEEKALSLLSSLGPFLVRDGMNTFGFGGHKSHEEILFGRYNAMTIYTKEPPKYREFFEELSLEETGDLVTAWQTFDEDNFGECRMLSTSDGKTIYDIPDAFKAFGMYFYERRGGNPASFGALLGKILLVSLTYYDENNEVTKRCQLWGEVTEADENQIVILRDNGEEISLPPDLSSIEKATKGEYVLDSTGEVVKDPDFTARWSIRHPGN